MNTGTTLARTLPPPRLFQTHWSSPRSCQDLLTGLSACFSGDSLSLLSQVCSSEIFPDHTIFKISTLIFQLLTLLSFWFIAFHNLIDYIYSFIVYFRLPWWLSGKESTWNAGDVGLIPGSKRSSGEGNGNPSQYSRLENPMNRGAWQVTIHGVGKELDTTEHAQSISLRYKLCLVHHCIPHS